MGWWQDEVRRQDIHSHRCRGNLTCALHSCPSQGPNNSVAASPTQNCSHYRPGEKLLLSDWFKLAFVCLKIGIMCFFVLRKIWSQIILCWSCLYIIKLLIWGIYLNMSKEETCRSIREKEWKDQSLNKSILHVPCPTSTSHVTSDHEFISRLPSEKCFNLCLVCHPTLTFGILSCIFRNVLKLRIAGIAIFKQPSGNTG